MVKYPTGSLTHYTKDQTDLYIQESKNIVKMLYFLIVE